MWSLFSSSVFILVANNDWWPSLRPVSTILTPIIFPYSALGPALTKALPASLDSYLTKFLTNLEAKSAAFLSHSAGLAYVSLGSKIFGSTPGNSVGTSKSKTADLSSGT